MKKVSTNRNVQKKDVSRTKVMSENQYFIKAGYQCQSQNHTLSEGEKDLYWTKDRVFLSKYYQWDIYKYSRDIAKNNAVNNVIDIGCGTGEKLMKLIYPICHDVTGVDQAEAIKYCNNQYNTGKFIVDNLEFPVVEHGPFDLVICSDVIEHIFDPDILLEYMRRVSHENTWLVFSTPERDILRGKNCMASEKIDHVREWNSNEFISYLTDRGFDIVLHRLSPFIKFSFRKKIRQLRKTIKERCGTVETNQLVLCKIAPLVS